MVALYLYTMHCLALVFVAAALALSAWAEEREAFVRIS
jgi:hypothetical protein